MDISIWCLLGAFVLIYAPRIPAIKAAVSAEGRYDLANPRAQQARLTGRGARAQAAHQNSVEAFAPFAAAVWVAYYGGADAMLRDALALLFVGARTLFVVAYLRDMNPWRTVVWTIGVLSVIGLFLSPLF
ncbi:MAG: MAPEG family protein [Gammaproteobacteria bacterium]